MTPKPPKQSIYFKGFQFIISKGFNRANKNHLRVKDAFYVKFSSPLCRYFREWGKFVEYTYIIRMHLEI